MKRIAATATAATLALTLGMGPAHAGHSSWIDSIKTRSIGCAIWSGWC